MMRYQDDAENEAGWEEEHPKEIEAALKTCSAGNAVVIARAMSRYPTLVRTGDVADPHCRTNTQTLLPGATTNHHIFLWKARASETKHVQFASDTNFESSWRRESYLRSAKAYVPGKHAAASSSTLINASNMLNDLFNAPQLKIIKELDCPWNIELIDAIALSNHEGIAELNPRWPDIRDRILCIREEKDQVPKKTFMKSLSIADYSLVNIDEQHQVTHVIQYTTRDIENLQGHDAEEFRTMKNMEWISHLEITSDECRDEIWSTYERAGGATRMESSGRNEEHGEGVATSVPRN